MRILIISQYFFPETGATSNRIYSLAKRFKEAGHQVHIIAEKPNHPQGIFFNGYKNKIFVEKKYKDIPVTYTWVYTRPKKGFLGRIFFYISFMIMAVIAALKNRSKFDFVIASSPPLFVGISGWLISKVKKAKFVFDVRDLWPDLAVAMNELNNRFFIKLAKKMEFFIYRKADAITTVSNGFCQAIEEPVNNQKIIKKIMNGTLEEIFLEANIPKNPFHSVKDLKNKFIVTYAGNIGICQGLEHIIMAAENLQDQKEIQFVLIGSGPVKGDLQKLAKEKELSNFHFFPRLSIEEVVDYMYHSNILLVPLAQKEIYKSFIPSKLFDSMACGRPILLSVDGEARQILEEAEAGIYYEAENSDQLAKNIELLLKNTPLAKEMGNNGQEYVRKRGTRKVQAQEMLEFLENMYVN